MKIVPKQRQCLADIALQTCGSIEAVLSIALRNDISITADLDCDGELLYELIDVKNKRIVEEYQSDAIAPAMAVDERFVQELMTLPNDDIITGEEYPLEPDIPENFTAIFTEYFANQFA